jgi:hypothetical protein
MAKVFWDFLFCRESHLNCFVPRRASMSSERDSLLRFSPSVPGVQEPSRLSHLPFLIFVTLIGFGLLVAGCLQYYFTSKLISVRVPALSLQLIGEANEGMRRTCDKSSVLLPEQISSPSLPSPRVDIGLVGR